MKNWFRNIGLLILLLLAGRMAAQVPVLDSVCSGAERHYRVDGEAGSTYTWILTPPSGPAVTLLSDADTLEMIWSYPAGVYELVCTQHALNGCDAEAVYGQVIIFEQADVYAGQDDLVCVGRYYKLVDATAGNCSSLLWQTSGDGTFDDNTYLNATYTPGANDILAGIVSLTLTGYGLLEDGGCEPAASHMELSIVYEIVPLFEPIGPLCQFSTAPALPDTSLQGMTGNWSPSTISTLVLGTFPYTFSPDDPAQCGVDTTIMITITHEIIPQFEPIGPLCIFSTAPALPDTSLEGITGTWEPPTISTGVPGTFTFTFTPGDPSQCGVETTMDIAVVTEINPLFEPIGPLCQYSIPTALPDTSLNGITGSWAPPVPSTDEPGTFSFIFTPYPDQCGLDTTIQITVLPQVTPVFEPIGPLCQYSNAPALPNISLNGITGIWNPAWINTTNPGTFTFTFIPDDPGQCGIVTSMEITVIPEIVPAFEPIGPLCRFSPAPALPDTSLQGIPGTWEPPVINTTVAGTFFFNFTPAENIPCVLPVTLVIDIVSDILPEFDPIGPLCQQSTPPDLPGTSNNGITGSWMPPVINTNVPGDFTFIFTPYPGQCALETSLVITIATKIIPVFDPVMPLCQHSVPPALPGISNNNITGTWLPAIINTNEPGTFTFTFTPDPDQCGSIVTMDISIVTEIIPEFDPIVPLCQNSTPPALPGTSKNGITGSWVPPTILTDIPGTFTFTFTPDDPGQCGVVTTLDISIVTEIIPEFEQIGPLCQNSTPTAIPVTSVNGITGTWFPPIPNIYEPGTFTYTFTPDDGQCAVVTTMQIEVLELVVPLFDQIGPLSQNTTAPPLPLSSNNVPAITGTWDPAIIDTSIPGTFTYTFTPDEGQCATVTDMEITVLFDYLQAITGPGRHCLGDAAIVPLEVDKFNSVAAFQLKLHYNVDKLYCEGYINVHPQLASYLTGWIDQVGGVITLQWQGPSAVTFTQQETILELTFTPKEEGQGDLQWYTGATESFFTDITGSPIPAEFFTEELNIYNPPSIIMAESKTVCEGENYMMIGIASSNYPPIRYLWTYPNGDTSSVEPSFSSVTHADAGIYTLSATDAMGCSDLKAIQLIVSDNPVATFHGTDTLFVPEDYNLEAGTGMASYLWNTGETSESIVIASDGMYSVEMISSVGCKGIDSVYVVILNEEIPKECMYVPNAFTPNGDGLNDTFNGVSACPLSFFRMEIFDRWGELMFESGDISNGWDGKYDGKLCPGDGYIYKIVYQAEGAPETAEKMTKVGMVVIIDN